MANEFVLEPITLLKIILVFFVLFLCRKPGQSQNLIPNAEFNDCQLCPPGGSVELRAVGKNDANVPPDWRSPSLGSSDILSLNPRSLHHCGGMHFGLEYLYNEFKEALKPLSVYRFTCYASSFFSSFNLDEFGVDITKEEPFYPVLGTLSFITPDYVTPDGRYIIERYEKIEFEFTACGGEQFVTVGRFSEWSDSELRKSIPGIPTEDTIIYVTVDDFSFDEVGFVPHGLPDTMVYCADTTLPILFDTSIYHWKWNGGYKAPLDVVGEGAYILQRACKSDSLWRFDTVHVMVPVSLPGDQETDTMICIEANKSIQLEPPYDSTWSYRWNTGDISPTIEVFTSGQYIAEIDNSCETSYQSFDVTFLSSQTCDSILCRSYIPNIISNNQDGLNDCLDIQGVLKTKSMQVYNRWGELLYEGHGENVQWCGSNLDGRLVSPGVYIYIVEGVCTDGQPRQLTGSITVLR